MDPLKKAAEKKQQEEEQTFSQKAATFLSDSSVLPLTRMYKSPSLFIKFAWCATFLFALGMFTYYTVTIITEYFKYPSEVTMKLEFSSTLDFPAITVCNMNPIRMKQVPKYPEIVKAIGLNEIDKMKNMMFERYEEEHEESEEEESEESTEGTTVAGGWQPVSTTDPGATTAPPPAPTIASGATAPTLAPTTAPTPAPTTAPGAIAAQPTTVAGGSAATTVSTTATSKYINHMFNTLNFELFSSSPPQIISIDLA
jgi:hypothetical protein